jgi:hypothetical protein
MKGLIEAALIALSIFFLSTFFTFDDFSFYQIYAIRLNYFLFFIFDFIVVLDDRFQREKPSSDDH